MSVYLKMGRYDQISSLADPVRNLLAACAARPGSISARMAVVTAIPNRRHRRRRSPCVDLGHHYAAGPLRPPAEPRLKKAIQGNL